MVAQTVLLTATMVSAGYLGGRLHGWMERRETEAQLRVTTDEHQRAFENAERKHVQELVSVQRAAAQARGDHNALRELVTLYEGLRRCEQAESALDARNFGLAESHLRGAEQALAGRPDGHAIAELASIRARLSATHVGVAANLEDQRDAIRAISASLNGLLERERVARKLDTGPDRSDRSP